MALLMLFSQEGQGYQDKVKGIRINLWLKRGCLHVTKEDLSVPWRIKSISLPVCSPLWGEVLRHIVTPSPVPSTLVENDCVDDRQIVDVAELDALAGV